MKSKDFLSVEVSKKVRERIPSMISFGYIDCDHNFVGTFDGNKTRYLGCDKPLFLFSQVRGYFERNFLVIGTVVIDKTLEPKYAWVIEQYDRKHDQNFGWKQDVLSPKLYRTRKEAEDELVLKLLEYTI